MRKYSKNGHLFFCVLLRKNLHIGGDLKKIVFFQEMEKTPKNGHFICPFFAFLAKKFHIGGDFKKNSVF